MAEFFRRPWFFLLEALVFAQYVSLTFSGGCEGAHRITSVGVVMQYRFAEFELDLSQQELRRLGESVHIEPQVFDLIVHLVRNNDRIVSKDELIETIWNGRIISEAALSSRINGARRALGDNGTDQLFIRTLHKRGFRFVGDVQAISAPEAGAEAAPLVPEDRAAPADAPARVLVSAEVSRLGDIVSESVKAEANTRSSIAVLPFGNMSGDPENDYFSYGLTEDIIRLLARYRWLSVISRHSTVGFQGRVIDAREVGELLGVRYVMVGSVRKSRDTVRITAELVRAADGKQLWADKYDLQLEYIFDIQEEMARQIAATIEPELSKVEQQLATRKAPESLDAWDCYQRGLWNLWRFTTPGFDSAETYFQRAIAADPSFARGHGALSYVNLQRAFIDEPKDRAARLETALRQGRHAVALDELDCFCHCALGRALCLTHQNDEALAALDVSLELNPSFAQAYFAQGFNLLWYGREIEAETLLDRAIMLSPRDSHISAFHHVRSWAHFSLGEYDIAVEFARRATRQPNVTYQAFASLAASLGLLGDRAQAETAAAELLQRKPNYNIETARQEFFFCNDVGFIDRFVEGLRVAGIANA
ncbi:winged helix-turn-helix domain-containing tetratricopeptide repeat protein [Bradyrhizobium sp. AUGA SZCCT0283]|uniref:winged helix-turn-helix domain-containing tetratricopeptide repeat protein n=1 Tax=Bradyrhizobium sp. AUGA SZCCT0283 TaxID=2807671 RepID=UPI001BA9164E|nr:winged helix-turn-helix domain-containing protein [Bradyrhizobium sp. AUGA SZCCT0283]MBR1274732.1 winged helix-turn-helix domain-containing protein [Bradyrhizobium sp. AUGA SZCCT0283]